MRPAGLGDPPARPADRRLDLRARRRGVDPRPGRGGLASLTADLLDEGTASRSSHQIALAVEGMGTSLSASAGWDGAYIGLQCLTTHLEASLDLAVDVLRNPSFPTEEWDRVHAQTLAGLKAERDSAEARAEPGLAPGPVRRRSPVPGARRRRGGDGRPTDPRRPDRRSTRNATRRTTRPSSWPATSIPRRLVRRLEERLAGLVGPVVGKGRRSARPNGSTHPRLLLLDRPGAPQAVVRVGHVGTHRLDPDYTDLMVWNQILGGQFTSRLNARLREEKGFTYGVRSHFDFRKGAGPFLISSSLQSDRLAEALEDLRGEVFGLLGDRPPTASELDDARRSLIEGQARHFETPSALVSRYAGLFLHGLPADHHAGFAERLEAVSLSQPRSGGPATGRPPGVRLRGRGRRRSRRRAARSPRLGTGRTVRRAGRAPRMKNPGDRPANRGRSSRYCMEVETRDPVNPAHDFPCRRRLPL